MNHHEHEHEHRHLHRIVFGLFIIAIGVLALLDNLHVFDARAILQFWPTIFVVVGALKISHTRHPAGYLIGAAFIAVGVLMTLQHLDIIQFRMRDWWPAFLIGGGVYLLVKGLFRGAPPRSCGNVAVELQHDAHLHAAAVMSGNKLNCDAQDFRGGELTAVMGGIELDLRSASIRTEAVLRVFAFWGGIQIKVPADWSVISNGVPILGGIEDRSVPPATPTKRLVIDGYVVMGGVEIKN